MLSLRYARKSRSLIYPPSAASPAVISSVAEVPPPPNPSTSIYALANNNESVAEFSRNQDLAYYFREWFMSRKIPLYDRIFEILRAQDGPASDADLSRFNLCLNEELVLEVLRYNKKDVLSCLKFFDWAGRQPGFFHTRQTFTAIFRIISKAKLTNVMLDFLQNYSRHSYNGKKLYHNVLVVGYALAGQCETALSVFGNMRFLGHDLDRVAYKVLLNALVDEGHYTFVESMAGEIRTRGYEDPAIHSIMIKSYCKQNDLERAEEYLHDMVNADGSKWNGHAVATLVAALCKNSQFEKAYVLMEEFKRMGADAMQHVYSAWISELVKVGKTDDALEFLKDKQAIDQYVPDVFRFNMLICSLLKENRLIDVYDLLVDMNKRGVLPDDVTMNAVLGFLCKAGMMDVAVGLYNSKAELGFSVNYMAYNYLINAMLGEATIEESYRVLKNALEHGCLPGKKTMSIVANALCREGKFEKMKELAMFILDKKLLPADFVYDKFVAAFCNTNKVDEAYMLHDLLTRLNRGSQKRAYYSMIGGFCRSNRGSIAARLLLEMQDSGFRPRRRLYRRVISCICRMDEPESRFFELLEIQLTRSVISHSETFETFLLGAGYGGKPELAMQVYEIMRNQGIETHLNSSLVLLRCFLKKKRIAEAFALFCEFCMKWRSKRLWNIMIVGLCKIQEAEYASKMMENLQKAGLSPSMECYEELIKLYCDLAQYNSAIDLLTDMTRFGRPISSFIGNVFLLHSLKNVYLYDAWVSSSATKNLTTTSWMLGHLIGIFSSSIEGNYLDEDLTTLIESCFKIDLYTYNMMLKRLSMKGMDSRSAHKLVQQLREKGYMPNVWTYNAIIHGLARQGRYEEAIKWMKEMALHGFDPSGYLKRVRLG